MRTHGVSLPELEVPLYDLKHEWVGMGGAYGLSGSHLHKFRSRTPRLLTPRSLVLVHLVVPIHRSRPPTKTPIVRYLILLSPQPQPANMDCAGRAGRTLKLGAQPSSLPYGC